MFSFSRVRFEDFEEDLNKNFYENFGEDISNNSNGGLRFYEDIRNLFADRPY